MLSADKVYYISGLAVDAATETEKDVVNNKFNLIFMPKTTFLSAINDYLDILYQHLQPFVLFRDVSPCSHTRDNVIRIYNLQSKV